MLSRKRHFSFCSAQGDGLFAFKVQRPFGLEPHILCYRLGPQIMLNIE
jgi:hypothetical protein